MNSEKFVQKNYNVMPGVKVPVKMWNKHVTIEQQALDQLLQITAMPFVKPYVAAMPDTHWGMGATVGSVIPTQGAVMPAAVGVDIGCGMMAVRTNVKIHKTLPNWLPTIFDAISKAVPHGRTDNGGPGDRGAWGTVPADIAEIWKSEFATSFAGLAYSHPDAISKNAERHLGTLGTGNHFIEVCTEIDNPESNLWVVLHSGSRGLGNRIGTYFTKLAGELCEKWFVKLPNKDLGYFPVGTSEYEDYILAVHLAQKFAWMNREIMMGRVLGAIGATMDDAGPGHSVPAQIHMHHNYASITEIQGKKTILTRKGAVDASAGKWCIIPGSMGQKTAIAQGLGNRESFFSCSHGAGRSMSRTQALKTFTIEDHAKATEGVYCDKTEGTLDETPGAYKLIDDVMKSQEDLVKPILYIKQLVCIKGISE